MNDGIGIVDKPRMTPPAQSYLLQDAAHKKKCEFAVRLGYRWDQAEAVLLGKPDATEDEMLAKLVQLYAKASPTRSRPPYSSRFGSESPPADPSCLRPIVIDGSNVAMAHGKGKVFSCHGILLAVQYFRDRGHKDITVFVPSWRKEASKPESPISDQEILLRLEKDEQLVFTPSKRIGEKRIVCYDDRFIVKLATSKAGVIVSNDNYRDLKNESDAWRETIDKRVLMFTFAQDYFMVPDDPYGRNGPSLEQLLKFDTSPPPSKGQTTQKQSGKICPHMEKCTFGKKCRFYHPEREEPSNSSKASHSIHHSRTNSVEEGSPPLVQPDHFLGSPSHPSRTLDISEVEEKMSMLNIFPEPCLSDNDQRPYTSTVRSVSPSPQALESLGHRCTSALQIPPHEVSMTANKRCSYSLIHSSGHPSKPLDPIICPTSSGVLGRSNPESIRSSFTLHRDMNGQLLSRGAAADLSPSPPRWQPSNFPMQYSSPSPPQSQFREQNVYYPPQPSIFSHRDHYNCYYLNHTDSFIDQSHRPSPGERDYQSVHQSNLYLNVLAKLGPQYGSDIISFLHRHPNVQNVDYIVDHILRKH